MCVRAASPHRGHRRRVRGGLRGGGVPDGDELRHDQAGGDERHGGWRRRVLPQAREARPGFCPG